MGDTPNHPDKDRVEAFFNAIEHVQLDKARQILAEHPEAVNWEIDKGFAPLHWASLGLLKEGMKEFAIELIEKGANPNKFQPIPYGAPMILFVLGHTHGEDLALKLMEKGADLEWKSEPGSEKRVMDLAEQYPGSLWFLSGHGTTLLMSAAASGAVRFADALLKKGADIHAKDSRGQTALMYAMQSGKPEIVEFLIKRGANIAECDGQGHSMRTIAEKGLYQCAVMPLEDAFRHVSEAVVPAMHAGSEKPITVSRKPIQFKGKP